tara:strand:+ start:7329 stop:7637 length:309 start_codon:yes stop_codon:yes gene_type:complete
MKSANKYLLLLVAILVLSLGIGIYFKFSPKALEAMTTMPTSAPEVSAPTQAAVATELPSLKTLPTVTPLPLLKEPSATSAPSDMLSSSSDLLVPSGLNFSEL